MSDGVSPGPVLPATTTRAGKMRFATTAEATGRAAGVVLDAAQVGASFVDVSTAQTVGGNKTWSGTHSFVTQASADASQAPATNAWVKLFFPGLSTSVQGTGVAGLDMPSGGKFLVTSTTTSLSTENTLFAIQKTTNYSGGSSSDGGKAAMTVDNFVTNAAVGSFQNAFNATLTSYATTGAFNVGANLISVAKAYNVSNTWGALVGMYDFAPPSAGTLSKGRTGLEVDMYCFGSDPNLQRIGLEVCIGTPDGSVPSSAPVAAYGLAIGPVGGDTRYGSFQNAISITGNPGTALNLFSASCTANAILSVGFIVSPSGDTTVKSLISSNFSINAGGLGTFVSIKTGAVNLPTGQLQFSGGNIYLDNPQTGGGIVLRTGAALTPVLTIDGSNNATFAGTVRVPSYTVATLPAAGAAGRIAHCSNARMFNGAGTQEVSGSGSGGLVEDNGSAWKLPGTNVTVSA